MVYIYKKLIKEKPYYYLRLSSRKGDKIIVKDIAYLGNDPSQIKANLENIQEKYKQEIRKGYKTIKRFLESNNYLEQAKKLKLKSDDLLRNTELLELEACRIHWLNKFQKLDELTKKEMLKNFIIEYSYNTASIEGNTITLKQTRDLFLENKTPKDKDLREIYDLQNTEEVFNWILNQKTEITHDLIITIHKKLMNNMDKRTGYRTMDVRILHARFESTPAEYVIPDMKILLQWYNNNEKSLHPLALAGIFHHKFEKIHPFMDGNGRTGRMLMNYILLNKSYPLIMIRNSKRKEYLKSLSKADECVLTKTETKYYKNLTSFVAKELVTNYWNQFL